MRLRSRLLKPAKFLHCKSLIKICCLVRKVRVRVSVTVGVVGRVG